MDRAEFEELLLEALSDICPNFSISEDRNGQIIILTRLSEDPDTEELESTIDDDPDADPDFDGDFDPLDETDEDE